MPFDTITKEKDQITLEVPIRALKIPQIRERLVDEKSSRRQILGPEFLHPSLV